MKKALLFLTGFLTCFLFARGTNHFVEVANFSFSPATLNVIVGDTITWTWKNGTHTTTSTSVPSGAATWDAAIDAASTSFSYKVTVEGTYNYWCTIHAPNMAGTINATGSLPVVLTNFTVASTSNNQALLSWNTVTEINTAYFTIKRSEDGKQFLPIANVPAVGNSSSMQSYRYVDDQLKLDSKYLYYTLEIVDKDGKKSLSNIIMFKNNAVPDKIIRSISPNPVRRPGHLMFQFNAEKEEQLLVQIFDMNGKLVQDAQVSSVAGLNNGHLHISQLAAGIYNLVFTLGKSSEKYKLVIQ